MASPRRNGSRKLLQPLDYMLSVMRDSGADWKRRDRMARAAVQYCHARREPQGKKARAAEEARQAAAGWDGLLSPTEPH